MVFLLICSKIQFCTVTTFVLQKLGQPLTTGPPPERCLSEQGPETQEPVDFGLESVTLTPLVLSQNLTFLVLQVT